MTVVKAYKNEAFLMSETARPVRILCEYLEPARRFEQLGVRNTVIFFGSARLKPAPASGSDYYGAAADLAERLARWTWEHHADGHRYHIVSGGGPGIMEAAHAGAARVDRSLNIGLNISLPFEQHINPYLADERAVEFHYFFMRKFWFLNLARGAVIFPGGFGTLDELFELLTLTQTGKSSAMPILLYGGEFWRRLVNWEFLLERGLISPEDLQQFQFVDEVDEAFERLRGGLEAVGAP
jgi:uncharacterized protein (TIGR00730 family)